ncbi:MAG: 3-phosphoglycerate dehydrogenase [Proteobacteria bacterium]|nr:3-phosphoglycerate dehydrogenase [Pseudomonadota bacterium]MBU1709599.1 3-phosphoglycerate dehydrogenase [Pseudomonadota bacterium]
MEPIRIKTINKIAQEGLVLFGDAYSVGPDQEDPQGIIVRSSQLDTDVYPNLLAVARAGAGVNNITVDKATAKGICVFNTPGANANAVAELVFIMLGIEARNIRQGVDFCRSLSDLSDEKITKEVEKKKAAFRGFELAGKTLGVLGLGKIGVRVANGGALRGMKVIGFDPSPAIENIHQLSPEVVISRSIDEVISNANILSIHVPLSDKTSRLVNGELISRLPDDATIVNYARAPIVDEDAVLAALDSGKLSGYLTDFPTSKSLNHPKVLVSPHLGASTEESEEQCACMAVSEIKSYFEYGTVIHSVNFPTVESIPSGNVHTRLIMINRDIPGMIGFASHTIGSHGININSYLNSSNGAIGYNIIDLEQAISKDQLAAIDANPDVIRTRTIVYRKS